MDFGFRTLPPSLEDTKKFDPKIFQADCAWRIEERRPFFAEGADGSVTGVREWDNRNFIFRRRVGGGAR